MARHSAKDVAQSIEQAEEQHDHVVARAVDLTKTYGDADSQVVALDHVNVEFQRGQMTAIMGPSGSGKSTLMHCMAGLDNRLPARCLSKASKCLRWARSSSPT